MPIIHQTRATETAAFAAGHEDATAELERTGEPSAVLLWIAEDESRDLSAPEQHYLGGMRSALADWRIR